MASTEKIQIDMKVTGATQAASEVEKVGKSLDKTAKSSKSFETQVSGTNTAVGGLISALSAADPRIAQFTFAINGARTAMTGLVSALGGVGGLAAGVAAGGAIAALAMFARSQRDAAQASEELNAKLQAQATLLARITEALPGATGTGLTSSEALLRQFEQQLGAGNLKGERFDILRAKAAAERRAAPRTSVGPGGELIIEEAPTITDLSGTGRLTGAKRREFLTGKKPGQSRQAGGPTEFDRLQAVDAQIAALDKQLAAPGEKRAAAQLADEQALAEQRVQMRVSAIKEGFEQEREARELAMAEEQRAYDEHMARVKATRMATQQSILNLGEFATQSFAKGLSSLVKGQKVAVAAILEGIGDQMVAEGTHMLFKAAAAALIPGMGIASGPLAAVGAAEVAAGLALGATAAGAQAPGGGGGGLGTARPVMSVDRSQDDRPIIINVQNTLAPTAEAGVWVNESQARARQTMGDYASR